VEEHEGMTASADETMPEAERAVERLSAQGVRLVALSWVDTAGIGRVKAVPLRRLPQATRWGVGVSPVFDTYLVDDSRAEADPFTGPVGDLRLIPDLARLTPLAAQPGWAWVPADRRTQGDEPHPGCSRTFAARMVREAAGRGLTVRMGFETEWTVEPEPAGTGFQPVAGSAAAVPASASSTSSSSPGRIGAGPAYGLARLVDAGAYLLEAAEALASQEVEVLQIHPEFEVGQFEVSTAPEDPVGAADTAVLVRHTLRAVSRRHGLLPSFAPMHTVSGAANGGHLHLSLWRGDRDLLQGGQGAHGLTEEGEAFLAGVLRALPALMAIGCPTPASYLRLKPSNWAGVYQCWGLENREAALRFVTGMAGQRAESANAEVKCFDEAANPYLVVGAVVAAGLAGREEGLRLPDAFPGDPGVADPAELEKLGVRRLPDSLPEAVRHFASSTLLRRALGDRLFEAVVAVRNGETELFAGRPPAEIVAATRHRY
jgi:glutamine synthetase